MAALSVALESGAGANDPGLLRPVMMDSNGPGTELFVLDAEGNLHELRVKSGALEQYGNFVLPSNFAPADMTYALTDAKESLVIAGARSGRGTVVRYSMDGSIMQTWNLKGVCSGIDYSPGDRSAYVATSDSKEIYRLEFQNNKAVLVTQIDDAAKLGPLAFDEGHRGIYVADVAAGKIYRYSLANGASAALVSNLSAPTALSFDPETNRLYVADPGRHGIFFVDTLANKPAATPLVSGALKAPYGMALLSQNRLAVADYGANSVLVFSSTGALLFRFPPLNK